MENVRIENLKNKLPDRPRFHRDELITVEDLNDFKRQLVFEIKLLLKEQAGQPTRKWLKSREVRKLLGICPTTLQNLRNSGKLPFTRLGGTIYHDEADIQALKHNG